MVFIASDYFVFMLVVVVLSCVPTRNGVVKIDNDDVK